MKFDFAEFFRSVGIEYRTEGKNTKAGWVNINCPLCGDDRGFHCGCNPESGGWACWRDSTHRSLSTAKLVRILINCSWEKAKEIAGDEEIKPGLESWDQLGASVEVLGQVSVKTGKSIKFPKEFREIHSRYPMSMFYEYLWRRRHFDKADIPKLCQDYQLKGCTSGDWNRRLILPIVTEDGVIGWQGRSIGQSGLRYLTHPDSQVAKRVLFNQGPASEGGKVLALVEGPVDSVKIDFYGKEYGYRASGTLGTAFLSAQIACIYRIAERFDRVMILFDPGAEVQANLLASKLSPFSPIVGQILDGRDDAGDLRPIEVKKCIRRNL